MLAPSVMRTIALARLGRSLSWLSAEREGGADPGSVRQLPDLHPLQHLAEQSGVRRKRGLEKRPPGENDETEQVAVAATGEVTQHAAGDLEPVPRLEVGRLHAAGDVEREHEIPCLAADLAHFVGDLRPRQRGYQQHQGGDPEDVGQVAPARATGPRLTRKEAERRKADALVRRQTPPEHQPRREGQRPQRAGGGTRDQRTASSSSPAGAAARCHRSSRSRARSTNWSASSA